MTSAIARKSVTELTRRKARTFGIEGTVSSHSSNP